MDTVLTAGQDFARRRDYSALVLLAVDPLERKAEVAGIKVWPHIQYQTVIRDTLTIYLRKHWKLLCIDVLPVGELVSEEYSTLGIPHEPVTFTLTSKQAMVQGTLLLLSQGRLVLKGKSPNDQELLKQIREQELIKSDAGNDRYGHPDSSHDDVFWALCLAVRAARRYLFEQKASVRSSLDIAQNTGASNYLAMEAAFKRWESPLSTSTFAEAYSADSYPARWLPKREDDSEGSSL